MATAELTAISNYVTQLTVADPESAVKIALAEAARQQALAEKASAEYRALAEVEFDDRGHIARANMAGLYRLAQAYARSQIVPDQYRGKPDDCFIACQMAFRLRVDPMAYMQASYVVHGRPGLEAKFAIGLLNTSGLIRGRISYSDSGSIEKGDRQCVASAIDAATGEVVSATVTWKMVAAEGWNKKAGSKWVTMPDVMFRYRAAAFLIRTHYPEVLSGMPMVDEIEDSSPKSTSRNALSALNGLAARFGAPVTDEATEPARSEVDDEHATDGDGQPVADGADGGSQESPAQESGGDEPIGAEAALRAEITMQLARAASFGQDSLRKVWTKYCGPESTLSDDLRQHAQAEYERLLPTARPQGRGKAAGKQGDLLT